jgi:hypothetical protein
MKNKSIRVFFRKDRDNEVVELVFNKRKVNSEYLLSATKCKVISDDPEFLFDTMYPSDEAFEKAMGKMTVQLKNFGWMQELDDALACNYNTYSDGALMNSYVGTEVDNVEDMRFPMYAHMIPTNAQECYWSNGLRVLKGDKPEITAENQKVLKDIQFAVQNPFSFYLTGEGEFQKIVLNDVQMLEIPYYIRKNIFMDLVDVCETISPKLIENQDQLDSYCATAFGTVVLFHGDSIATPGFPHYNAYHYKAEPYNETMVLDIKEGKALCIDPLFEGKIFSVKLKGITAEMSDLINKNDAKLKTSIS